MKYDKNVIDILRMYGKSKGLHVEVEEEMRKAFDYRIETMLTFYDGGVVIQKVLLTWPEDMDAVDLIKNVMGSIDDAINKSNALNLDIPSLYPKSMLNSVYGATGGYVHSVDTDSIDFVKYSKMDVKMTELLNKRFNSSKPIPSIEKVIFNDPATIIFWKDGTKTIVKAQDGDVFDEEKGLAMAICKKIFGNKGNYCNELKKWLPDEGDKGIFVPLAPDEIKQKLKTLTELKKMVNEMLEEGEEK